MSKYLNEFIEELNKIEKIVAQDIEENFFHIDSILPLVSTIDSFKYLINEYKDSEGLVELLQYKVGDIDNLYPIISLIGNRAWYNDKNTTVLLAEYLTTNEA